MINKMFGNLAIGDKFHTGKARHAGADSDVVYWLEFEKISPSKAVVIKQVGDGNTRQVGAIKVFYHNSSVFDLDK